MRIETALRDRLMLGAALGDPAPWSTWLALLKAMEGLPLSETEQAAFASVCGGREAPLAPVSELWVIAGRRSGKSRMAGALCVYHALFRKHVLAVGETGVVLSLSATNDQARTVLNYAQGFIDACPLLARRVEGSTNDEIRLHGGITIMSRPNSFRTIRGKTLLAVVFDECAYWRDETSANPDVETYRAVLPSLDASGGVLVGIGSPYRRAGLLFDRHKKYFGQADADVLVVQGPSTVFNPLLDKKKIAQAYVDDPEAANSEWGGLFRSDISSYLDDATIDAAVDEDRPDELPYNASYRYEAFADASGGRHDAYVLAVGHKEKENIVIDVVRGYSPPFDPREVTVQLAFLAKAYHVKCVQGDNYSGEWVSAAWESQGVHYERSDLTASQLYTEMIPVFTRKQILIPVHPVLVRELRMLERRTSRTGHDTISHPAGDCDDHANSIAGLCRVLQKPANRAFQGIYNANARERAAFDARWNQ